MDILTLITCAIGLSMDAFAVSVCKGLAIQKLNMKQQAIVGAWFGGFQGLMPLFGYLLGVNFREYIVQIDHWIAFVLLGYIGGKMIWDALHEDNEGQACDIEERLDLKELLIMAVATSIDALAVGVGFSTELSGYGEGFFTAAIIGVATMVISTAGVYIGKLFGGLLKQKAEILGGVILVGIGLKILIEHLFF